MKKILLLCILFSSICQTFAQSNPVSEYIDHYSNVIPETPNASTFTKYGGTTLNLSKGVPNINIPIYSFTIDDVTIPISLSYDASGIKTNELATAVGLKWRLNAGGGVFRSINNMADDNGWLTSNGTLDNDWFRANPHQSKETQHTLKTQTFDHSPDDFSYNINSHSGSFIFQKKNINSILKNKNDNFKLTPIRPIQAITGFTGQDVNGNTYHFGSSINSQEFNATTVTVGTNQSINSNANEYRSSWLIDRIITKNNQTINFEYVEYSMDYTLYQQSEKVTRYGKVTQEQYGIGGHCGDAGFKCGTLPNGQYVTTSHIFNHDKTSIQNMPVNKLIRKIYTNNIEINFIYDNVLTNVIWNKKLVSIQIIDKLSNNTRTFNFSYDLYTGDPRLKLKEVSEVIGNEQKPPYKFTYNETYLMPDKNTFSRDIFGYYNGADNPSSALTFTPYSYSNLPLVLKNILADRRPSLDHLLSGNLIAIQYPTGGKSVLEYELNQEDNGLGMEKYEEGGFELDLGADDFSTVNSNFSEYTYNFNVPENTLLMRTYSDNGSSINTSNIFCNTSSNAQDTNGSNFCNDPSVPPGIDCSQYKILDMDNNGALVTATRIGYEGPTSLPSGNYKIVVLVRNSEITTPNLAVKIKYKWYREFLDANQNRIKDPHYAGGLRVKKTKDIDTNGKIYNETEYEYFGLTGQNRSNDNYSELLANDEYVMSTDFIGLPKLFKSGYFYKKVTTKKIGTTPNGFTQIIKTENTFEEDFSNNSYESKPKGVFMFDENNNITSKTLYAYETNATPYDYYTLGKLDYCYNTNNDGAPCPNIVTGYNSHQNTIFDQFESRMTKEVSTQYFFNNLLPTGSLTNLSEFNYNSDELISKKTNNFQLTENSNLDYYDSANYSFNTNNKKIITDYTYPKNHLNEPVFQDFVNNKNLLGLPVSVIVKDGNREVSGSFFEYDAKGNIKNLFNHNKGQSSNNSNNNYVPIDYELNASYIVDTSGNPIDVSKTDGTHTAYIWGYNKQYPVAKIENATYATIEALSGFGADFNLDATGLTEQQETTLRTSLPNAQVTTFKYKPLVGITSSTDPKGYTMTYHYDEFNRLKHVKDAQGNILSENEYHYAN